jgi:ribosomal protein L40E
MSENQLHSRYSVKPGRVPSAVAAVFGVGAVVFGLCWTAIASSLTAGIPYVGTFFTGFGIFFISMAVIGVLYNAYNAAHPNRIATFDIERTTTIDVDPSKQGIVPADNLNAHFCSHCGAEVAGDANFCYRCGDKLANQLRP